MRNLSSKISNHVIIIFELVEILNEYLGGLDNNDYYEDISFSV